MTDGRIKGKVALVTGGGQGIGRAICLRLAKDGAHVVVTDLNSENADSVAKEISELGGSALSLPLDVTVKDDVRQLVQKVIKDNNGLDILVNNAGVGTFNSIFDIDEHELDFQYAVNVKGLFFALQAAAEYMSEQKKGKIINLASQAGRRGEAYVLSYCQTKAAVISITQSAALALAPYNVTVNAVSPGVVDTPFWEKADKMFAKLWDLPIGEPKRRAIADIPLKRIEQPEDVANVVSFLASSDSNYMTGQTLGVEGGNILHN